MTSNKKFGVAALAGIFMMVGALGSATAQDDPVEIFMACEVIKHDIDRLACFDWAVSRAKARPRQKPTSAPSVSSAPQSQAPATAPASRRRPKGRRAQANRA